jgi:dihydroflavonol-4-reductase
MKAGTHYIISKYLGELAALEICKQGLPLVVVNPAEVIGVRDINPTPSGKLILNVLNRKWPGYSAGGNNFVGVEDVARGHILAAQKGKIGERYILGNTNLRYKEFFDLVAETAELKPLRVKIPCRVVYGLGYLYQAVSFFTRKAPLMDAKNAKLSCRYFYFDNGRAVKELGMPQTPVRTTVEKAVDWFRENGYVKGK